MCVCWAVVGVRGQHYSGKWLLAALTALPSLVRQETPNSSLRWTPEQLQSCEQCLSSFPFLFSANNVVLYFPSGAF